jgi:hypothetical protein
MVEERVYVERGRSGLGIFLSIAIILLLVVGGILWSTGALVVNRDAQDRVHVTYDPSRAKNAGSDVLGKTGKALEHAGEKIERQAHKPTGREPVQR